MCLAMFVIIGGMTSCEDYELIEQICIDTSLVDTDLNCEKNYKPVCGCDDITYQNECFATKAGVLKWNQGKCK